MKKAFIIMAHQKPQMINNFICQILNENPLNDIFVHVNKDYECILPEIYKNSRVYICENRLSIRWGRDTFLQAILLMFKMVIDQQKEYDYVIVCSGQDMFVKKGLDDFLDKNYGQMFIDCDGKNIDENDRYRRALLLHKFPNLLKNKFDYKYNPLKMMRSLLIRLYIKCPNLFKKKCDFNTENMTFYYDKFWQITPYELVKYIIKYLSDNPDFMSIYYGGFMTDESFFSTIIMNSQYKDRIHFYDGCSKSYTYISRIVNNHPNVITMDDIESITDSGCFFARKFDDKIDENVIAYYLKMFGGKNV